MTETATFGAGCFWGVEAAFQRVLGVIDTAYEKLLDTFWQAHDPTQVNRQGPDFGAQYRSAIFFHSAEQEAAAKKSRAALEASGKLKRPIATEITPASTFYRAEEYHQKYLQKRGVASCHF